MKLCSVCFAALTGVEAGATEAMEGAGVEEATTKVGICMPLINFVLTHLARHERAWIVSQWGVSESRLGAALRLHHLVCNKVLDITCQQIEGSGH